MKTTSTFTEFLCEGGAALKAVQKVSQEEIREMLPDLLHKIKKVLELKKDQVKVVGSAGKKEDGEMSGDIDVVVEFPVDQLEGKLPRLAYDEKTVRAMRGINVYSFAYEHNGKIVQVDLIPTKSVDYASWAMQANPIDLEQGLKGSHRNELMFATAKHANMKEDEDGNLERYFYDMSRGLYKGTQKKGKKGGYKTIDKEFVTNDVDSVAKILYGQRASRENTNTFKSCLDHIKSENFPHANVRDKILAMAARGMEKKGLKIPKDLQS